MSIMMMLISFITNKSFDAIVVVKMTKIHNLL